MILALPSGGASCAGPWPRVQDPDCPLPIFARPQLAAMHLQLMQVIQVNHLCSSVSAFSRPLLQWVFPCCAWAQSLLPSVPSTFLLPPLASGPSSGWWGSLLDPPGWQSHSWRCCHLPGGPDFCPPVLRGPTGFLPPGPGLGKLPL